MIIYNTVKEHQYLDLLAQTNPKQVLTNWPPKKHYDGKKNGYWRE